MPLKRRKLKGKKPATPAIKQKTARPAKKIGRKVLNKAAGTTVKPSGFAGVKKVVVQKTALVLPVAGEFARFSIAPPENLPVENFDARKMSVPMLPEFASETEAVNAGIAPPANLLSTMRTYGTLVASPAAAVGDAPPGSADVLLSAHEMEEYGLADAATNPEAKACKRWWGFCLPPRQSFWVGTLFGVAAMGLLTVSVWILVANSVVQAASR